MTKIVGADGRILNTDFYEMVCFVVDGDGEVVAIPSHAPAEGSVVFSGTEQECRQYLRKLAALTGAFEYKDGGFHHVGGPNE